MLQTKQFRIGVGFFRNGPSWSAFDYSVHEKGVVVFVTMHILLRKESIREIMENAMCVVDLRNMNPIPRI